ncbi:MAG TPA: phosphatase PAP2 family protein [Mycobacteriales bacterium]|nr:phosphatase PAP2 family protein [Mycobacteriales bacterium]
MRDRRAGAVACSALVAFGVLLVLVAVGAADGLDHPVARLVGRHPSSAGADAARLVTDALSPGVDTAVLLVGAAVVSHRRRLLRPLAVAVAVVIAVTVVVLAVKHGLDRPLPHSGGRPDDGFPSGHTATTACFLGALAVLMTAGHRRLLTRMLAAVAGLSLLVGASLVYAGYHWLTDVLASLALGVATVAGLCLDRVGRSLIRPDDRPGARVERHRRPSRP